MLSNNCEYNVMIIQYIPTQRPCLSMSYIYLKTIKSQYNFINTVTLCMHVSITSAAEPRIDKSDYNITPTPTCKY